MYRSIIVPLDGSPFAEQAVAVALAIAEASHAKVTLVRAWDPADYRYTSELTPPFLDPEAPDRLRATEYLEGLASRLRPATGVTIDVAVVAGPAVDAIRECLTNIDADLVVMTTHGLTGWSRAWIGSVADALVRVVTVPVLLCRPLEAPTATTTPGRFACVLIPLDGSAEAEQILTHAAEIAPGSGARFILLRVERPVATPVHPYPYAAPAWQTDQAATEEVVTQARQYLTARAESLKVRCPQATVDVDVRLADHTGGAIIDAARDYKADLVALTTHARRGVRLVLGSVADKALRGTHASVLLLRPSVEPARVLESERAVANGMTGVVI
jgi:nucleotide-binding universal stress UspA family protein